MDIVLDAIHQAHQTPSYLMYNEVVLTIRLEQAMVDALDELAEKVYQDRGVRISRMDLIREAIHDRLKRGGQTLTSTEA